MIRRAGRWVLAAVALGCLSSAGCSAVRMTAGGSVNPVMFGPSKALDGGPVPRESSRIPGGTVFHHRESSWTWIFASVGGGGAGVIGSSTDPWNGEEENPDWSLTLAGKLDNPARLDWKVLRATGEDPARRVELTSIRCGGVNSYFIVGIMNRSGCELEGFVPPENDR